MAEGIEKRIREIRKDGWEGCVMGQRRRMSGCGGSPTEMKVEWVVMRRKSVRLVKRNTDNVPIVHGTDMLRIGEAE
jgi:hypothetical protein